MVPTLRNRQENEMQELTTARAPAAELPQLLPESDRTTIASRDFLRADGAGVILRPHGNEIDMGMLFNDSSKVQYLADIRTELVDRFIRDKRVLVLPAYATNSFLFANLGAREVVAADADPKTCAWLRGVAAYYHHERLGDLFMSTVEFPNAEAAWDVTSEVCPGKSPHAACTERLVAAAEKHLDFKPLENLRVVQGALGGALELQGKEVPRVTAALTQSDPGFDFIYVPFLLGVRNGIEDDALIEAAFEDLYEMGKDGAVIMIGPFAGTCDDFAENVESTRNPGVIARLGEMLPRGKLELLNTFSPGSEALHALIRINKTPDAKPS